MNFKKLMLGLTVGVFLFSCTKEAEESGNAEKKLDQAAVIQKAAQKKDAHAGHNHEKPDEKEAPKDLTSIKFEESVYDFGTIQQGDKVKHTFKFTNTGEFPLLISNIKTSCGCTTPSYTKTPVAPKEQGEIEVQFNSAGKKGIQNKNITVFANVEGGSERIMIKTNVNAPDNTEGPIKKKLKKDTSK